MTSMLIAAFVLGLSGSLHCLGMCGPIALALPLGRAKGWKRLGGIGLYNAGRLSTYVALGALLSAFGWGLKLAGAQQYVSLILGGTIVLFSVLMLFKNNLKRLHIPAFAFVRRGLGKLLKNKGSLFLIGVLNGFIPCGLVYLAIAGAVVSETVTQGTLFMLFFGLGTVPMMAVIPALTQQISANWRARFNRIVPYTMIAFGMLLLVRGMNLDIPYLSPGIADNGEQVHDCCSAPTPYVSDY